MNRDYYTSAELVDRLCHAANTETGQVVFLVGSALCMPDYLGGHGVPGVGGLIDLIRRDFADSDAAAELETKLGSSMPDEYQNAFRGSCMPGKAKMPSIGSSVPQCGQLSTLTIGPPNYREDCRQTMLTVRHVVPFPPALALGICLVRSIPLADSWSTLQTRSDVLC